MHSESSLGTGGKSHEVHHHDINAGTATGAESCIDAHHEYIHVLPDAERERGTDHHPRRYEV